MSQDVAFSDRTVPWMKIGKLVDKPANAKDAAELGGLNFTVSKRPLFFEGDNEQILPIKERTAVVRDDTSAFLGVMSKNYPLVQYSEAFDFMDTLDVSTEYVAAGSLKSGRQGFIVVRVPELASHLIKNDPTDMFMVLRTSHDGSRAVEVMIMPLRNRCMNQLTLQSFAKGVPHRWSITHSGNVAVKLSEAKKSIANLGKYATRYEELVEKLVNVKVKDDATATKILEETLPVRPKTAEVIERVITKWHTSETVGKEFDFTGYGLLNALSDDLDWGRGGGTPESRFIGALQGSTHKYINRLTARILTRA